MTFNFKRASFVDHAGTPRIEISGRRHDGIETDYITIVVASPALAEQASKELLEAAIQMRTHLRAKRGEKLNKLYEQKANIEREIAEIEGERQRTPTSLQPMDN